MPRIVIECSDFRQWENDTVVFTNTIIILHFPYCSFNFELLFEKALLDY